MIKLIAFDMDGVVIDSMPRLREIGIEIFQEELHINQSTAKNYYDCTVGLPFKKQLDAIWPELKPSMRVNDAVAHRYEKLHIESCKDFCVAKGFTDIMRCMKTITPTRYPHGVMSTALVSSTNRYVIYKHLPQVMELDFDFVMGRSSVWSPLPNGRSTFTDCLDKAQQISTLMYVLNIKASEVHYIGDSEQDAIYAEQLGVVFSYATHKSLTALSTSTGQKLVEFLKL